MTKDARKIFSLDEKDNLPDDFCVIMDMAAKPLLLLHQRYTPDDQIVWREAIRRGWSTERIGTARIDIERKTMGRNFIRYYGNTLHHAECGTALPVKCTPINPKNLTLLPEFTKRQIELVRAETISNPVREDIFLKCPGSKWIESKVYKAGTNFGPLKPDDLIYAQSILGGIRAEIRSFVINGEIQTASYYYNSNHIFEPKELLDISDDIRVMAKSIYQRCDWPSGVVFDFGILDNNELFFIEANEAWCSGVYHCNPVGVFDTIVASQK